MLKLAFILATLTIPLEGILLQNEGCDQCVASLQHQVHLLQQRLNALEMGEQPIPSIFLSCKLTFFGEICVLYLEC